MEIERATQIATREWENIRASLKRCGDIGPFFSEKQIGGSPDVLSVSNGLILLKNLIGMDTKFSTCGYYTPEAAIVFAHLGSKAGKRLGLNCSLAQSFGSGYNWVRTGLFDPNGIETNQVIKQLFFYKFFFPLGGFFNWDFSTQVIKTKLELVFYKFNKWQDNPMMFIQDVGTYRDQLHPIWKGLSSSFIGLPQEFPGIEPSQIEQLAKASNFQ